MLRPRRAIYSACLTSCPPLVLLSLIRGRQPLLTGAGHGHALGVPNVAAIPGAKAFGGNEVTNLQRIPGPAIPQEHVGAIHFKAPIRYRSTVVFDVDIEPGVGIGPLEFRDRARQLQRFLGVEFRRKGMVCDRWPRTQEHSDSYNANRQCSSHCSTSPIG